MIYETACEYLGMTKAEIEDLDKIARGLSRYAKRAEKMGLVIFGGAGNGTIRKSDVEGGSIILASLEGSRAWDGGVGAVREDDNGILRGE